MLKDKIIIGTWSLSGSFGNIEKKEIYKVLEFAIESGFLEFDLAPNYGNGIIENIFSDLKKYYPDILINTKCGNNIQNIKSFNERDITKSINRSIDLLKSINILYLHNPRDEVSDIRSLIKLLNKYKDENLIQHTGISFARNHYFEKKDIDQLDFIQDEINLLHCSNVSILEKFNCKIIARSPLASGVLSGNLNLNSVFEPQDYRYSWLRGQRLKNILKQIKELEKIIDCDIRKYSKYFVLKHSAINKVIFGVKSKKHIEELLRDVDTFEQESFSNFTNVIKLSEKNYNLKDFNNAY